MPPKKRGRPSKASKKEAEERDKRAPVQKRFTTRKDAYKAARANFEKIKTEAKRLPDPGAREFAPSTALNAIETLFRNFLGKTPASLPFELVEQHLPGFWSDKDVSCIQVEPSDLRGGKHGAVKIVEVFLRVLDKGYLPTQKADQLSLESLTTAQEWSKAILDAITEQVEELGAGSQALPSPVLSRSGSPSPQKIKHGKTGDEEAGSNTSSDDHEGANAENEDQLASDDDEEIPSAAQVKMASKRGSKAAVKVPTATASKGKAPSKTESKSKRRPSAAAAATQTKGKGGRGKRSSGSDDEQPARRRSGRQPAATQTPAEAVKTRPRYQPEAILMFKMPSSGILWPCAITDQDANEAVVAEGDYSDGCYVVQIIPTRTYFFASADSLSSLPTAKKRAVPDALKGLERQHYKKALELLVNSDEGRLKLDRWLNEAPSDDDEEESDGDEDQPQAKKAKV